MQKINIVIGLQLGDEGKGKVCNFLLANEHGERYTHTFRFNGGANAGHTIYQNGKKLVTHSIPSGVLHGVKSVIGPNCVVHPASFLREVYELCGNDLDKRNLIKIAKNAHVVTDEHIREEEKENKLGTTKRGIGPAYRDKANRTGIQAKDIPEFIPFLVDIYEEFYEKCPDAVVLMEGAQGYGLDISFGDYPMVTSSNCLSSAAFINGFPPQAIHNVYGVCKCYETYVGAKEFQDSNDPMLQKIQEVGKEFGATTGRKRQVNYLNLDELKKSARMNGVTKLIMNKMDILSSLDCWKMYDRGELIDLGTEEKFKQKISESVELIQHTFSWASQFYFSYRKDTI